MTLFNQKCRRIIFLTKKKRTALSSLQEVSSYKFIRSVSFGNICYVHDQRF